MMIVLWVFGLVVGVLALASYHLARWHEARSAAGWSYTDQALAASLPKRGLGKDAIAHLILSAWRLELQTKRHSAG
jgi:hypothetical protein